MGDDWETDGNEVHADPYNKSQFGGASSSEAPKVEEVREGVSNISVSEQQGGEEEVTPPPPPPPVEPTPAMPPAVSVKAPEPTPMASSEDSKEPKSASSTGSRKSSSLAPADAPAFLKGGESNAKAFTEKLSPEALAFFNELCEKPFSEQAVAFLNAYWVEVGSQAEFIFDVMFDVIKYADMHAKGVNYIHLYEEGNDLDFNIGLYFYEKLCKKVLDDADGKKWRDDPKYAMSMPTMMTAIKRKIELREKVDCNFDGRVSMLEVLLYQYEDHANPADFTFRAMKTADVEEHPEIVKARNALAEVNKRIQEYEAEKHRLTELAAKPGVKGLGAKHSLAILESSPLWEALNKALITAEAAVRIASRKFGNGAVAATSSGEEVQHKKPTEGSMWWLNKDLEEKKKLYGRRSK